MKINLIPEAKQIQKRAQKINIISTTVALALVALVVVSILILLAVFVADKTRIKNLNQSIDSTNQSLKEYKKLEETVISLEEGLKDIKSILAGKSKWSLFFTELEKATPADIQFKKIEIKENTAKAEVIGRDINSLARFVESFKTHKVNGTNLFKNVDISGYEKRGGRVEFSSEFEINTEALWK